MNIISLARRAIDAIHKRRDPIGYARKIGVIVGKDCRLINVSFSSEPYLIELGDHVSATQTRFETHDGGVWVSRHLDPEIDRIDRIKVGNNVFIGFGSIILPGVTIGNNVVIGAASVVTKSIPDNSVAAGVPARVLGPVEAYWDKVLKSGQKTKSLSYDDKKNFYLETSA
tara:strand:- start:61 stop:570 length:510 start_codon:yes stop_codon:yes gene_type:complete